MRHFTRMVLAGTAICAIALQMSMAAAAEIRIGFATGDSADYAPPFAAESLDLFAEAGLDVRLIAFRGGAAAQEAMTAGAVDIITYFGPAVALAVSRGAREQMVATISAGALGWKMIVPVDSPIRTIEDLEGRTVGISTTASTSDMASLWVAERAGVTLQQIPLGAGALIPSLRANQVDAIVFSALLTSKEVLEGRARTLISLGEVMEPTMMNVYVASQNMIDNRPDELRAVLGVIWEALDHMKANRDWSIEFLREFANADDLELANQLYDDIILNLSADGAIEAEWVENGLNLAARAWSMPELATIDAETLFTNDFHPGAN